MKVAVKDACVLIDLANGGLIDYWFQMKIETWTTDLVLRQVKRDVQWAVIEGYVVAGLLKVRGLSGDELTEMHEEFRHLPGGPEDRSVLWLATKLPAAIVLTGDRRVRIEGIRIRLEVRGLLWVLDQLVEKELLPPKLAVVKLKAILEHGAFLPENDCKTRMERWNG